MIVKIFFSCFHLEDVYTRNRLHWISEEQGYFIDPKEAGPYGPLYASVSTVCDKYWASVKQGFFSIRYSDEELKTSTLVYIFGDLGSWLRTEFEIFRT